MQARVAGWTLIELVVALLIVAVLASLAVPGYRNHALRAHRTEAQSALLGLAAAQERFHLHHDRYASDADLVVAPPGGLGLSAATRDGRYRLAIGAADTRSFTATAVASGDQSADVRCATFTIDAFGTRSATDVAGIAAEGCWE